MQTAALTTPWCASMCICTQSPSTDLNTGALQRSILLASPASSKKSSAIILTWDCQSAQMVTLPRNGTSSETPHTRLYWKPLGREHGDTRFGSKHQETLLPALKVKQKAVLLYKTHPSTNTLTPLRTARNCSVLFVIQERIVCPPTLHDIIESFYDKSFHIL